MTDADTRYEELTRDALLTVVGEKDREIEKLHHLLHQLKKQAFGKKSEKRELDIEQLHLFLFESPEQTQPTEPSETTTTVAEHSRTVVRGRKPLPDNLPRKRIEHFPEERHCTCCKGALEFFDGEVTEELEHVPAQLIVNEHVRMKGVCPSCKDGVKRAELPSEVKPLERRRPGPGLLTYIAISKFIDHLPYYRLEQQFLRQGALIARQRMSDWMAALVDEILYPLWRALKIEVLLCRYLQGDETTIRVLDPEIEGKCHTGYFWAVLAPPERIAFFEYHESRAGAVAEQIFSGFSGVLQTDLYAGYNPVILPGGVDRIACLAHVRRKFIDAERTAKRECTKVLMLIGKLYEYERKWKTATADARLSLRATHSSPVLTELHRYLEELSVKTLPRAPLMEAVKYTLGQWQDIERIFSSGTYELDNNGIERQIRPVAIGRKNYLFAGSHQGAARSAVIYSLFATCKLNRIDPSQWLRDVIPRVLDHPRARIGELLPHRWQPLQKTP